MATRRVIARAVIETGEFEELSVLAQLFYLRLNLIADDDGFADAFTLRKMLAVSDDELAELTQGDFLRKVPDKKHLYHIRHWRIHNTIDRTKYHASPYFDKLKELYAPDEYLSVLPSWYRKDTESVPQDNSDTESVPQSNLTILSQLNQDNSTLSMSKSLSTATDDDADLDHDSFFQKYFPARLKELLATFECFKAVTIDELRKLLYTDHIAPEVIAWIAAQAHDSGPDSPKNYFWSVVRTKCLNADGQGCKTLAQLRSLEETSLHDRAQIDAIAEHVDRIRKQLEQDWCIANEQPF